MSEPVDLDGIEARCGFTVTADGIEAPCDLPAPSWRWYQGHEHEDCLDRACIDHENAGGIRMAELVAEVRALRAKVDAVRAVVEDEYGFTHDAVRAALSAKEPRPRRASDDLFDLVGFVIDHGSPDESTRAAALQTLLLRAFARRATIPEAEAELRTIAARHASHPDYRQEWKQ